MGKKVGSIGARFIELASRYVEHDLLLEVLQTLNDVIPCGMVAYNEVSRDDGRSRGRTLPEDWIERHAQLVPVFERWHHQPPALQPGALQLGQAARRSDADFESFRQSELYNQFMLPAGTRYQLCFSLPSHAGVSRGFALCRELEDFTDEEVALCNEIAPYLAVLFSSAGKRALLFVQSLAPERWTAQAVEC